VSHCVEVRLSNGRELRIVTSYEPPPVPFRNCDWTAVDDRTYDGPGNPIGWGATEQQAIDDLLEQICNDEDVCPPNCKACAMEAARG
jgi:hypothetical protein